MSVENITDSELVSGCAKNNRKFQELLYKKYSKKMYAICLSYADDRQAAQDILQDGFIKVYAHIKDFHQTGSLEGWIRRIITHTAIDHFRQTSRLNKFIESEKQNYKEGFVETILSKINFEELLTVVKKLPQGARIIFNMYAIEGYTHEEISKQLEISVGTSKSQFSRAKQLLQEKLAEMKY